MPVFASLILLFTAALMFFLGYLIKNKKQYWLISGYNTYSTEQKKQVDVENLGKLMGNYCYILGVLFLLSSMFGILKFEVISVVTILILLPITVIAITRAQKYDKNALTPSGKFKGTTKLVIGFVLVSCLIPVPLIYSSIQDYNVTYDGEKYVVKSFMGTSIDKDDIIGVEILDQPIEIITKISGSNLGEINRGSFKIKDFGVVRLYSDSNKGPIIVVRTSSNITILNKKTADETKVLYELFMK